MENNVQTWNKKWGRHCKDRPKFLPSKKITPKGENIMKQMKKVIVNLIIPVILIILIGLLIIINKNTDINLLSEIRKIIPQAAISADDVVKIRRCWIC